MQDDLQNPTGLVTKPLVDLQRLIVCAICSEEEMPNMTQEERRQIKVVIGASGFSARVNLIMKSCAAIRTLATVVANL